MRNTSIIIGILLSVIFFFIGYSTAGSFFTWTLPKAKNVIFISTALNDLFLFQILYSIVLGFIPLAIVCTWKIARIVSYKKRIYSLFVILGCVCLAGFIRYEFIKLTARKAYEAKKETMGYIPQTLFPISKVNIELYMLFGLIAGSVIVYFLYRQKKNKNVAFDFEE